jgi:hypothetical protein
VLVVRQATGARFGQSGRVALLHLEVHYGVDLASEPGPISNLCAALVALGFGSQARVLEYERDRGAVNVDLRDPVVVHRVVVEKGCARGPVFQGLASESGPRHPRRFGQVMLRGRTSRAWLGVRFDEYVPAMPIGDKWLFSNSVSFSTEKPRITSTPAHEWIRELLYHLVADSDVLWGAAWDSDEYRASNLHDDADGQWALGRDVRRSLPGLFWLNAFGSPYADMVGRDTLSTSPATTARVGSTAVVELYPSPGAWATASGRDTHERVLGHLGRRYFYDRQAPNQETTAPDFGLPELAPGKSLQVLTTDGQTFTVLPTSNA